MSEKLGEKTTADKITSHPTDYENAKEGMPQVISAIQYAAQGFWMTPQNRLKSKDLNQLFQSCIILIYRFLFILYAEAHGYLHFPNHLKKYSVQTLISQIRKQKDEVKQIEKEKSQNKQETYWKHINLLLLFIWQGSKATIGIKGIPALRLTIFDPEKYSFEDLKIPISYLRAAVCHLTQININDEKTKLIDYSKIKLRWLGDIYEQVLEYKLTIAIHDLSKNNGKYQSALSKEIQPDVQNGNIYLEPDNNRRKTTGTFYTPEYLIDFLLNHTLGILIQSRTEAARNKQVSEAQAILDIKIVDPAMGSGHFLLSCIEYLTTQFLAAQERDQENNREPELGMSPTAAKQYIGQHCIYGVDINPITTEIARAILQLAIFPPNNSFQKLNNHLKCGNALLSASLNRLGYHPATEIPPKKVTETVPNHIDLLTLSGALKHSFSTHPLRILADVHVSYFFGNTYAPDQYLHLINSLKHKHLWKTLQNETWIQCATQNLNEDIPQTSCIATKYQFFHWFLEFPEIFFNLEEKRLRTRPGFDVVIGNPPYNAIYSEEEKKFIKHYYHHSKGNYNSANQFIELAAKLARRFQGMIIPKSICYSHKWTRTRKFLLPQLEYLIDCSKAFDEVLLEQVVYISDHDSENSNVITGKFEQKTVTESIPIGKAFMQKIDTWITGISQPAIQLAQKMLKPNHFFSDITDIKRGVYLPGIVRSNGDIPLYRGSSIKRFYLEPAEDFITINDYQANEANFSYLRKKKLMLQNIIAHVENPVDRIITMAVVDENNRLDVDNVGNIFLNETHDNHSLYSLGGILQSSLLCWYLYRFVYGKAIRTMRYDGIHLSKTPLTYSKPLTDQITNVVQQLQILRTQQADISDNILHFLGKYRKGKPVHALATPMEGVSQTPLGHTIKKYTSLRIGKLRIFENNSEIILQATARFKPANPESFSLDRWGYIETDYIDALKFQNISKLEQLLVQHYLPCLVNSSSSSSRFHKKATKHISLLDRLNNIRLPQIADVKEQLIQFQEQNSQNLTLQSKIRQYEQELDALVFKLYGLTIEEIHLVLKSTTKTPKEKAIIFAYYEKLEGY